MMMLLCLLLIVGVGDRHRTITLNRKDHSCQFKIKSNQTKEIAACDKCIYVCVLLLCNSIVAVIGIDQCSVCWLVVAPALQEEEEAVMRPLSQREAREGEGARALQF